MLRWLVGVFICAWLPICGAATNNLPAHEMAGTAELVDGPASVQEQSGSPHPLHTGDTVYEGNVILTGKKGEVHLRLIDQTYLAIRPDTQFEIEAYHAEGSEQDFATFHVVKGALRAITGWIGHFNRSRYAITTSTATIGIRGTDHEIRVVQDDDAASGGGTYDHVIQGRIALQTQSGEVEIGPGEAAFAASNRESKPKVLEHVPDLFPKGKHDDLLEGLHDSVQKNMHSARKNRQIQIQKQERLGNLPAAEPKESAKEQPGSPESPRGAIDANNSEEAKEQHSQKKNTVSRQRNMRNIVRFHRKP